MFFWLIFRAFSTSSPLWSSTYPIPEARPSLFMMRWTPSIPLWMSQSWKKSSSSSLVTRNGRPSSLTT